MRAAYIVSGFFNHFGRKFLRALPIMAVAISMSCDEFLKVDVTPSVISKDQVFDNDVTATAAVTGLYVNLFEESFANGDFKSVTTLTALSSDELILYNQDPISIQFQDNNIDTQNAYILTLWTTLYKTIYQANSALEGLEGSKGVSTSTRNQLEGELLFVRAFCHFYLVNIFGDVPIITTTDYRANSVISRMIVADVYSQIKEDLQAAQSLLTDKYTGTGRVRPNRSTATALLSRVHLYLGEWSDAEAQATSIIENTTQYMLVDLNNVFLKNSNETIWQLLPVYPAGGIVTFEGYYFIADESFGGPRFYLLRDELVDSFEADDARLENWVGNWDTGTGIVHFPSKYKIAYDFTGVGAAEYSMVFRLAEQYLIRAEARAQQEDLSAAISDLDVIRNRAILPLIQDTNPGINQTDLLSVIEHERQVELFTEWGHRWFDLKRTGNADAALSSIKTNWNTEDVLYPIPQSERNKNPHLGNQNSGY